MLLKLSHLRQQQQADCLAACGAMVLAYLRIPISYTRILQALGTTAEGTPFHRLERLSNFGVNVTRGEGSFSILSAYLASGLPVIVDVYTAELPYWQTRTDIPECEKFTTHALVVVGIEEQTVYVYDPDIKDAPQAVDIGDFELAWLIRDYHYAVLQK
jgi:ABC-type bacteriocin/lantibiotic exporter with double-glycine peptidase domain